MTEWRSVRNPLTCCHGYPQLYLRVLEAILETETQRMPAEHWRVLLSEMFHKALLACSLEVVIFSYGLSDMEAPWYAPKTPLD
jgi:hypothetical protein